MLIKTEGIVIKTIDYGEGNKILTLYTKTHGKVAVMAKGARKTKSRLHAVTQVFSYGEYIFYLGRQMGTLNQGETIFRFSEVYQDIEKTAYAAYIVELLDKMTDEKEPNHYLYEQLLASFEHLNSNKDKEIIARLFEMKMLLIAGYRPRLNSCVICNSTENLTAFSVRHGGVICDKHQEKHAINIQKGTLKLLKLFEVMDIKRLGNIDVKDSTRVQLKFVLRSFYDEYVGIPLKSRNFLDQLDKMNNI